MKWQFIPGLDYVAVDKAGRRKSPKYVYSGPRKLDSLVS